jgi:hypothetical protein
VRVYVPATSRLLAALHKTGLIGPAPITAFAVTPGLREWYLDDDIEELEYAASLEAARASLRMIATSPSSVPRRIVIAADLADDLVKVRDDLDRGVVLIEAEVALGWCASVHVDDAEAEATIELAAPLVDDADLGDPLAQERVDDADGYELCWYATQEISDLVAEFEAHSS